MIKKIKDYKLENVYKKIINGERITVSEAKEIYNCPDPKVIGYLAHLVRKKLHSNITTYVLNQHINYTNICVNRCKFCAFSREKDQDGAFELTISQIKRKIEENINEPIREIHIVGGCHPHFGLDYYVDMIKELKRLRPNATLKCFTAVEIHHIAKISNLSVKDVLIKLKHAGLDMMPGGGAEIFDSEIRRKICPEKISGEKWLEIIETAHSLGIKTNCTMLFGHIESVEHRIHHLDKLRRLQDKTNGFICFIPLPFLTKNSRLKIKNEISGIEKLKTIALARIMLDNIPHIKSYWIMLGLKLAQAALYFGANDFDGTVVEEKIGHMAGATSPNVLARKELEDMITGCGFKPVQRDGLFRFVSQ